MAGIAVSTGCDILGFGCVAVDDLLYVASYPFPELLELVDHLILPADFARQLTGAEGLAAVEKLWNKQRQVVVVTGGAEGCWYRTASAARHLPAFPVKVVDTTGCGDVFHGAYAAGLARGLGLEDRLRYAAATAALKATRSGGQTGIPHRKEVETFLHEHSQSR